MYLATLLCLAAAAAAPAPSSSGKYLHLPLSRRFAERSNDDGLDSAISLERRADLDLDVALANNRSYYSIEFELGTPPQTLSLQIDTGSSDIWVLNEDACLAKDGCANSSIFDSTKSKSYETNNTEFFIKYGDQTGAIGQFAQDTMSIGGEKITNFNFAVANASTATEGVAGIGLAKGETPYELGQISAPYANLPQQLKQQGVTQQVAYSLWLNQNEQGTAAGSVLFGGIDHSKFVTDLYRMPLVHTSNKNAVTALAVELTGLSIYDSKGNEQPFASCNLPVLLDSGSTVSHLPVKLIAPFYSAIGVEKLTSTTYVVDCDLLSSKDGGLGIQIGGIDITVGFSDLFTKIVSSRTGKDYCIPGFDLTDDIPVIGDNILRTLYVVYDLENLEIGIAAAQTGANASSSSSIQVLSTGIPGKRATNSSNIDTLYATKSITLFSFGGAGSSASDAQSITSEEVNTAQRTSSLEITRAAATVPASVTQTIVIGAKAGAQSTKGSSSSDAASVTRTTSLFTLLAGLILALL